MPRPALDLTDPGTIRAVARRFGVRFQRRYGQNFLADRGALDRLISALELRTDDRVIEVGPGLGVLTQPLARHTASVVAIEIDPACVGALGLTLRGVANVRVVQGDVLRQPLSTLQPSPYRVIGNIPYNLTGALLVHVLEQVPAPRRVDLLVQREVALRIAAPPGAWSLATLGVRVFGAPEVVLTVPREAFVPAPTVASALVRIDPHAYPALPREDLPAFFGFARLFFQARRKQLPYVVSRGLDVDKVKARERLRVLGIDPARRAETLTLTEWGRVFSTLREEWKSDTMATP
jgi:16S rRNA (adenine1518-N6/adenine1519-N6)-dimethyltransferase